MIEIDVEHHNDVAIIYISGEFYIESVELAEKTWNEEVAKKPKVIGINCKNIKFIDSSAIGILVKFLNSAMKLKIDLVFFDLSDTVFSVFKAAKLGTFFKILSDSEFSIEYLK